VSLEEPDGVLVEPAPAALPLGLELEGAELEDEDAPPLAGLFVASLELEELEPEGELGDVVAPDEDAEPDGEVLGEVLVLPDEDAEPDGEVLGDVVEPLGLRSLLRLQPVTTAVPSARVTARANVESLMRPPWLSYKLQRARIGPKVLRRHRAPLTRNVSSQFFVVGCVSSLRGPAPSPLCWKSRC
jgi:hypothetical protein